jgi:hypothetical protein
MTPGRDEQMRGVVAIMPALALIVACHTGRVSGPSTGQTEQRPAPASASQADAIARFQAQLKEYTALHDRLEKTLPPLPKETNPQSIDKHQRALALLIAAERKTARRGDLFTPEGERLIRQLLKQVFSGPDGGKLKSTIMDENPTAVKLAVNGRYPDEIPLSTMPPQVLALLPKLPESLEYRFIGARLILLDVHAHTVADYMENVLP